MRRLGGFVAALLVGACSGGDRLTLFVGTYSDGFYAYEFDTASGTVVSEGAFPEAPGAVAKAPMPNPSFLAVDGTRVYAVSEMPDATAAVYAWRFGGGGFDLLGAQPTGLPQGGEDPCYVSTDGSFLAVANYSGGSLGVYRLRPGGGIAPLDSLLYSGTGGPDLLRQDVPHVHCAVFTPEGKHLLFSEFSSDEIGMLDVYAGGVRNYRRAARLHPDYGPRHLLFDAAGRHLYVIGELSGDITVFDYAAGVLEERQVVRADPMDARGAADLHLSPDGKFLYASLRLGNDGIAIFFVAPDGTLAPAGYQHTGMHPRNFTLSPDGRWLLVACRDEDAVEVYQRNAGTGQLADTGRRIRVEKPVFVGFTGSGTPRRPSR
ncbi:MAG: lactonase family protein [Bacteroidales bacterium]|nr:lactonase family protein [Bacteroidales bacterium]